MSEVIEGTVKWFNEKKGHGFITVEGRKDFFVHYSNIDADGFRILYEGQSVQFQPCEGPRGPYAAQVVDLSNKANGGAQ